MPANSDLGSDDGDLTLLAAAVRDAGALALEHFRRSGRSWTKDDGTPVGEADLAVDALLRERLASARPDYGWLSEESGDDSVRLQHRRVWVVDPIDGTRSFLEGGDQWTVVAALVEDGRPIAAQVLRPLSGEHFQARRGHGATCNGQPIAVSGRRKLAGARLVVPRSILKPGRWADPWPPVDVGMATSIALRLCKVATGDYDGALAVGGKSDWDLAAGDLIVHEAGGRVTDLAGDDMVYNRPRTRQKGLVAAGPGLIGDMLRHARGYHQTGGST